MEKSIPEGIKRRIILILLSGEYSSKAPRGIEAFDPSHLKLPSRV